MSLTLANKITICRLLFVPVYILLLVFYNISVNEISPQPILRWSAIILFIFMVSLDAFDGYIARTKGQITKLGTVIDPVADKILLVSSLIVLSGSPHGAFKIDFPKWYLFTVISRDTFLMIGAAIIHLICGNVIVQPRPSGKASTFFQIVLILWILTGLPPTAFPPLLHITTALIIYSTFGYFLDGMRQLNKPRFSG
ncbi:MAG: CDP-alcohol phosphatidyltransferase family protein [Fibrobacter sp.]|nr:CDP-alcohol phosphatidyltransferase family protein [Fibrobacter sp.]